jgi:putative transposase
MNTVGKIGSEAVIQAYVKEQGKEKEYKQLHFEQLKLL